MYLKHRSITFCVFQVFISLCEKKERKASAGESFLLQISSIFQLTTFGSQIVKEWYVLRKSKGQCGRSSLQPIGDLLCDCPV